MKQVLLFLLLAFWALQADGQRTRNVRMVWEWDDVSVPTAGNRGNRYSDVWGWIDSLRRKDYVILGSSAGTHFFDVTDRGFMQQVGYWPGRGGLSGRRDYAVSGEYAYAVSNEGDGSLQIFFLGSLPTSVEPLYDQDSLFQQARNLRTEGDRLYVCQPRSTTLPDPIPNSGLAIYDISQPLNPRLRKAYDRSTWPWGDAADVFLRNDTAWISAGNRGLWVVDFRNPDTPQVLLSYQNYDYAGFNNSAWLSDDGRSLVMSDEGHGLPLKLLDVSNLAQVQNLAYLEPYLGIGQPDLNAIPHLVCIKDSFAYAAYYYDGLMVFKIKDPAHPELSGYYDTYFPSNNRQYRGAWGVYPFLYNGFVAVSDAQTGLHILDFRTAFTAGVEAPEGPAFSWRQQGQSLHIQTASAAGLSATLCLRDLSGRGLARWQLPPGAKSFDFTLPGLSAGIYLLELRDKGGMALERLPIGLNRP